MIEHGVNTLYQPLVPDAEEHKRSFTLHLKIVWLLFFNASFTLVKAIHQLSILDLISEGTTR